MLAACLLSSSCSTPGSRIKKDFARFKTYPETAQKSIQSGKIELGFSEEMVRMALGAPDRVYRKTSPQGETTLWAYTSSSLDTGAVFLDPSVAAPGGAMSGTVRIDRPEERLRVAFEEGKVVSIERREK